jgi:hypothetical protein
LEVLGCQSHEISTRPIKMKSRWDFLDLPSIQYIYIPPFLAFSSWTIPRVTFEHFSDPKWVTALFCVRNPDRRWDSLRQVHSSDDTRPSIRSFHSLAATSVDCLSSWGQATSRNHRISKPCFFSQT